MNNGLEPLTYDVENIFLHYDFIDWNTLILEELVKDGTDTY